MHAADVFRRSLGRHLRRRRLVSLVTGARAGGRGALAVALFLLLAAALGVLPSPGDWRLSLGAYLGLLLLGVLLGATAGWLRVGSASAVARELDRNGGLGDLAGTAAALLDREGAEGRFAALTLQRAGGRLDRLPVVDGGPMPRPPWRLLAIAGVAAVLLVFLPEGGLGVLPGTGSGWGRGGGATDPVVEEGAGVGSTDAGEESSAGESDTTEDPAEDTPEIAPIVLVSSLDLVPLDRGYPAAGPLEVEIIARGAEGAGDGVPLSLAVSVDGGEPVDTGVEMEVRRDTRTGATVNLRAPAPLEEALGPGTHRVRARLVDDRGRTAGLSPVVEIVVMPPEGDGEGDGGGDSSPPPPPPPTPEPQAGNEEDPAAPPPPPPPAGDEGGQPPEPEIPESEFDRKWVDPQKGEGDEVLKKGPVLVLDPDGRRGDVPQPRTPEEVLAEVKARAEAAARREGMHPRDRGTVKRYFEMLRRLVEGR
ncbi:MAG: hypothetical protein ACYTDX_00440 [Planctomycetota bacterium]|jgi:hypothetical protein